MEGQVEVGRGLLGRHAQRVEVGAEVPARAVGGDHLQHGRLLLRIGVGGDDHAAAGLARGAHDVDHHQRMRNVPGLAAFQLVEVFAPFGRDRGGIRKPGLIEVFDEGGVTAGDMGRLAELLDQTAHDDLAGLAQWGGDADLGRGAVERPAGALSGTRKYKPG